MCYEFLLKVFVIVTLLSIAIAAMIVVTNVVNVGIRHAQI